MKSTNQIVLNAIARKACNGTARRGDRVYDEDHREYGVVTGYNDFTNNYTVKLDGGGEVYVHESSVRKASNACALNAATASYYGAGIKELVGKIQEKIATAKSADAANFRQAHLALTSNPAMIKDKNAAEDYGKIQSMHSDFVALLDSIASDLSHLKTA